MKYILLLLFLGGFVGLANAQPGTLDTSFGHKGRVESAGGSGYFAVMGLQKNDKIVIFAGNSVTRFNKDGFLDKTFGDSGHTVLDVESGRVFNSMCIQDDDKIIIGGYYGRYVNNGSGSRGKQNYDIVLVRLKPDGKPDNSFGKNGAVNKNLGNQEKCFAVKTQLDGKIVVAGSGSYSGFYSYEHFLVARFLPDGSVDKDFGTNGKTISMVSESTFTYASSLTIQKDDKIVLAGSTFSPVYPSDCAFARYRPDGSPDKSFGENGLKIINVSAGGDRINEVQVMADGRILACGYSGENMGGGNHSALLLALDPNGNLDTSFGNKGRIITRFGGTTSGFNAIEIQKDGKLIAVAPWTALDGKITYFLTARFLPDGSTDFAFGKGGTQTAGFGINSGSVAHDVALQKDGKIVVGGTIYQNSNYSLGLVRYYTDPAFTNIASTKNTVIGYVNAFTNTPVSKSTFTIFPNPAKNTITIQSAKAVTVCLQNSNGLVLTTQKINGSGGMDISKLKAGIYYLVDVESGESFKIVKE